MTNDVEERGKITCGTDTGTTFDEVLRFSCPERTIGRYLLIMRPSTNAVVRKENYLVVCEVVVMGVNAHYQPTGKLQKNLLFGTGERKVQVEVGERRAGQLGRLYINITNII